MISVESGISPPPSPFLLLIFALNQVLHIDHIHPLANFRQLLINRCMANLESYWSRFVCLRKSPSFQGPGSLPSNIDDNNLGTLDLFFMDIFSMQLGKN